MPGEQNRTDYLLAWPMFYSDYRFFFFSIFLYFFKSLNKNVYVLFDSHIFSVFFLIYFFIESISLSTYLLRFYFITISLYRIHFFLNLFYNFKILNFSVLKYKYITIAKIISNFQIT